MEPTECSETPSFNFETPGKYPEENKPYLQHGESLKTTNSVFKCPVVTFVISLTLAVTTI
jgi:hypothetical protein